MEKKTREKLIDAARQCLVEEGHGACSVKMIATRAGVNHGLVHHYFGSKENLWLELIRREVQEIRELMQIPAAGFIDQFLVPEFLRHPDRMRLVIEFLALSKQYPSVLAEIREVFLLRRGQMQKMLGNQDPSDGLLVVSAFFGMAVQVHLDASLPVETAARKLLRLLGEEKQ